MGTLRPKECTSINALNRLMGPTSAKACEWNYLLKLLSSTLIISFAGDKGSLV